MPAIREGFRGLSVGNPEVMVPSVCENQFRVARQNEADNRQLALMELPVWPIIREQ